MKLTQAIVSLFFLASAVLGVGNAEQDDSEQEYQQDLNAVNEALNDFASTTSFCPGVGLALSCGDGNCENDSGENSITCPSDCSPALIHSYNSQTFCNNVQEIVKPRTYEEIKDIVSHAASQNRRLRVVGKAHSTNTQLCTDGVVISTENLNRVLGIETFEGFETVVVETGVTEKVLTEWLNDHGKSIGYGLVGFYGISVGGMVATGAHGSSTKHSALLASAVQSFLIVTADGELREYSENTTDPELFKALRTHMGMFGVVVQMRIKIRPQFNLDTRVSFMSENILLDADTPMELLENCDFGQIHWFPRSKKIMKTCGVETNKSADSGAKNIYLDPYIPRSLVTPYKIAFHYGACSTSFNGLFEKLRYSISRWQPPLVKEDDDGDIVNSAHVIGPSHRMLSSQLGLGRETLIVRDWEVAVPQSHVKAALIALKEYMADHRLALPITGFYLRFSPVEKNTLLSNVVVDGYFKEGEVATFIEFPAYYPIGFSAVDKENYARLYENMIHFLIEKFHGRPHWGKNNENVFLAHKNKGNEQHLVQRFKSWVDFFDSEGLFANTFGDLIFDETTNQCRDQYL